MDNLKLLSLCAYLTDTDVPWRQSDYCASKMVKALKGDPINGYFEYPIGGIVRRFSQNNVADFVKRVPPALAKMIIRHHDEPATLVPIPNSHVVAVDTPDFRTLDLAQKIAANSGGRFKVEPALVFSEPQQKSRDGGPRDPRHFEDVYRVTSDLRGPIILVDDVATTGGHLIGAHWKLHREKSPIVLASAFGRTTKAQLANPIGLREDSLTVGRDEWA